MRDFFIARIIDSVGQVIKAVTIHKITDKNNNLYTNCLGKPFIIFWKRHSPVSRLDVLNNYI